MPVTRITRVTIDGLEVPFGGEFGSPSWAFTVGVSAPEIVWRLDPAAADQVLSKAEVEIVFDYENAPKLTIKRVVVVKEVPSGSFFVRAVLLSDIRWYWARKWIKRSYNVRMRTGSKRLVNGPVGAPTQLTPFADDIAFAKYSLKNDKQGSHPSPWNADDMILDVAQALPGQVSKNTARDRSALKPNDVELDDRGDHALARVLGAAGGGIDVRVHESGTAILFDRVLGDEKGMLEQFLGSTLDQLGQLRWVRMNHVLPVGITFWFTREMELRLDFLENPPGATIPSIDDTPSLDNVCQIADFTIKVNGNTEVQGTWVRLADYLAAINANPGAAPFPAPGPNFNPPQSLDTSVLQDRFLGPYMFLQYVTGLGVVPSQLWSGRVGSLMGSYRTDFRIDRRFFSRILPGSIRATRTGLADATTGLRQPSPVYMDFCQRPTVRMLAANKDAPLGWNVHILPPTNAPQDLGSLGSKNYPNSINVSDCSAIAPFVLSVVDPQVGILRITAKKDSFDQAQDLVPSLVQKLPTTNPFNVATLAALSTWDMAQLAKNHRMITIISCVPAGPNNDAQLQGVSVSFDQGLQKLGVQKGGMKAEGPVLEQRVSPALERSRYAWDDTQRGAILGAFMDQAGFPASLTPTNLDVMQDLSAAFGATIYASMLDHYEGTQSVEFNPKLFPTGSVHTVVHSVDPQGRALTTVNAEARGVPVKPEALMSIATRRVLLREIGM